MPTSQNPARVVEVIADLIIALLILYPVVFFGFVQKYCAIGQCGGLVDAMMQPALMLGAVVFFTGLIFPLLVIVLIAIGVSIVMKIKRYAANNLSLLRILYSIPMIALATVALWLSGTLR